MLPQKAIMVATPKQGVYPSTVSIPEAEGFGLASDRRRVITFVTSYALCHDRTTVRAVELLLWRVDDLVPLIRSKGTCTRFPLDRHNVGDRHLRGNVARYTVGAAVPWI